MIQIDPGEYLELLGYKAMVEWLKDNHQSLHLVVSQQRQPTTKTAPAYEVVSVVEGWAVGDGEPFDTPEEAIAAAMREN